AAAGDQGLRPRAAPLLLPEVPEGAVIAPGEELQRALAVQGQRRGAATDVVQRGHQSEVKPSPEGRRGGARRGLIAAAGMVFMCQSSGLSPPKSPLWRIAAVSVGWRLRPLRHRCRA